MTQGGEHYVTINAAGAPVLVIRADGVRTNGLGIPLDDLSREALLEIVGKLTDLIMGKRQDDR